MNANLFWFDDEQWSKVMPHLPTNQQGPERHDDRRILSGIMHVQKVGCRWKDCPSEYGPHKTIYNRFARWSERGIWQSIFAAVAASSDAPGQMALDSSHVKIHRCASGGKRGAQAQAIGITKGGRNSRFTRLSTSYVGLGCWSLLPATQRIV